MDSNGPQTSNVITEEDILSAPLEESHKAILIEHLRQLWMTINKDEPDQKASKAKREARQQLARTTVVLNDYTARYGNGRFDNKVSSMIANLAPTFACKVLEGREDEVAALVREVQAKEVREVVEKYLARPCTDKVLPYHSRAMDSDKRSYSGSVLRRSKSEDDLLHHRVYEEDIRDWEDHIKKLCERNDAGLVQVWPPTAEQLNAFAAKGPINTRTLPWE